MRGRTKSLVAAGVALGLASGTLLYAGTADAAATLSVTLSAYGTGASAVWNSSGDPVLTVGSPSSSTYAEMSINDVPTAAPSTAPSFDTNNYTGGSPRWEITFADGDSLYGYPSQSGLGSSNWEVIPASSGACADQTHTPQYDTYANSLAFIQNAGCAGNVTGAAIVADGDQTAGTSDTITNVSYDGETIVESTDVVTVANPGAQTSTAGTGIGTLQMSASSSLGYAITSWSASGLPAGLSISSTGAITGTPSTAGTYSVTVTATDSSGVSGSITFSWTVNASSSTGTGTGTATYSGTIRLTKLGLCLDDRFNSNTPGAVVQVWGCNGLPNQQWQVMSNGTIQHNGLCLDARHSGTASGTKVQLWTCTGNANQQWTTSDWHIQYNNPGASDEVLDDTGWGGSGTQQDIWTDNGGANQIWTTWGS
jgi:hypothetical protein